MPDFTIRTALVHDWLNQLGGAEDVLAELVPLYADSPIFTSIYWRAKMPEAWRLWPIHTLWLDRLPGIYRHHQPYLPLYPLAFGGLDLSDYDVVISNKSGFCHGVKTGPNTLHVCYCLAPTRYVWQYESYVRRERVGGLVQAALSPLISVLRRWDYAAAQRVTHFIAISTEVRERIKRFYQRESVVIYPPVDTERFARAASVDQVEDYYLVLSRLIPYKRIDLAVEACTRLGLPLIVAGSGRDRQRLETLAGPTVNFAGYVPDADLPSLMARCKALIFPGLEDFGITPVQAQAAGRPVIAYRGGGALDTVIPGVSGELFEEPTLESLMAALESFDASHYSPTAMRTHAAKFDAEVFRRELTAFVAKAYQEFRARVTLPLTHLS
ncbi:MAG TPA: glycosyltransferase [Aggregatilineales bacterium]|nr:glycosyltransferase [Aggregatilineales bacterium]